MSFKTSDLIKGIVLFSGIAHVMIYFNGHWNDVFFMTAILGMGIPLSIYKFLPNGTKKKRHARSPPENLI